VDKVFEHSLKKENITLGFKICRIWPLNFISMARKFGPNELLITLKKRIMKIDALPSSLIDSNVNPR
jgi:hypothetical protein